MSKTNIFSTPEHYEAPVCETIDAMVEMNFLASDGNQDFEKGEEKDPFGN